MNSRRNWKTITVIQDQKDNAIHFNLDDKERITPRLKRQKRRSMMLAKIGFYENEEMKNQFDKKMQKSTEDKSKEFFIYNTTFKNNIVSNNNHISNSTCQTDAIKDEKEFDILQENDQEENYDMEDNFDYFEEIGFII